MFSHLRSKDSTVLRLRENACPRAEASQRTCGKEAGEVAGAAGFEPAKCRIQSPMPYRLAKPHEGGFRKRSRTPISRLRTARPTIGRSETMPDRRRSGRQFVCCRWWNLFGISIVPFYSFNWRKRCGFEPTDPLSRTFDFQGRRLRPLGHVSLNPLAEPVGFEPTGPLLEVRLLSKQVPSTARPRLR